MRATLDLPKSERIYELALEGLVRVDEWMYRHVPGLPSVYEGGIKYKPDPVEAWKHAADVARDRSGDCEDLASMRAGELRAGGEANARVEVIRTGPNTVHARVVRADGSVEDPAARLGMYDPANQAALRQKRGGMRGAFVRDFADPGTWHSDDEDLIGADPAPGNCDISWAVERTDKGWRGTVRVPLSCVPGQPARALTISRGSASKKGAAETALNAAASVLDNPAVAAVIPGPARFALNLVRSGKARDMAKSILSLF